LPGERPGPPGRLGRRGRRDLVRAGPIAPGRVGPVTPARFDIDMQHCPNCGCRELEFIAAILERPVIEKILTHLGVRACEQSRHARSSAPNGATHRCKCSP
jgi:hypothetical protein